MLMSIAQLLQLTLTTKGNYLNFLLLNRTQIFMKGQKADIFMKGQKADRRA